MKIAWPSRLITAVAARTSVIGRRHLPSARAAFASPKCQPSRERSLRHAIWRHRRTMASSESWARLKCTSLQQITARILILCATPATPILGFGLLEILDY